MEDEYNSQCGSEINAQIFFRTQNTIFELLKDRNYIVDDNQKLTKEEYEEQQDDIIKLNFENEEGDKITVRWYNCDIGVVLINKLYQELSEDNIQTAIIVKSKKLTSPANATINDMSTMKNVINIFDVEELINNKTKHFLVPKHTLLTNSEEMEIMKQYSLKKSQFPKLIYSQCPIVKYYGWSRGNIIKITRKTSVTYRCVC